MDQMRCLDRDLRNEYRSSDELVTLLSKRIGLALSSLLYRNLLYHNLLYRNLLYHVNLPYCVLKCVLKCHKLHKYTVIILVSHNNYYKSLQLENITISSSS